MTAAATTGPTPNSPVRLVPAAGDGGGELLPGLADPGVDAAQVLDEGRGELAAGCRYRVRRCDRSEDLRGLACGDRLGDAARNQLAQHGMQPADDLGTAAAQVPVPLGPDLQHRRVIIGPDLPDASRPQRCDGHRPGIVGVVLVHIASGQQPDPRAELGRYIQHPLTSGQQLLGQQMPQAAGALDRPGPLRPGRGPFQQPLRLRRAGAYPQLTQRLLRRADHHRRVRGLVRIDPDHHCRHGKHSLPLPADKDRGGHAQFQDLRSAHTSFEPRHGEAPAGWHVVRKPSPAGRQAVQEPAHRDLSTLRPDSLPSRPGPHRLPQVSIGRLGERSLRPSPSLSVMVRSP